MRAETTIERGGVAAPARPRQAAAYVAVLLVAAVLALGYKLRIVGLFACGAGGYSSERYLGYCNVGAYGDYDHGAFWFGLEPEAARSAARADVVFLGSSRMQFGFSAPATAAWFQARGLRHFLLGFSHTETVQFVAPLLQRAGLTARLYVINVDRFFDTRLTPPMQTIAETPDALDLYRERRRWQAVHEAVCGRLPAVCGDRLAFYRSRHDGSWLATGTQGLGPTGVGDRVQEPQQDWPAFIDIARRFVATLPVQRGCVVLTLVPSEETRRAEAMAIAAATGLPLVAPTIDGLRTFDSSHLDAASAQRWSQAFLAAAKPQIDACLGLPA